jgi:MFS family permease
VVAVANGIEDVAGYSLMQRRSADEVRGRVLSTFTTLGLMGNALAFAVAGGIVEAFGPRAVFVLSAVISAACVLFLRPMFKERADRRAARDSREPVSVVE